MCPGGFIATFGTLMIGTYPLATKLCVNAHHRSCASDHEESTKRMLIRAKQSFAVVCSQTEFGNQIETRTSTMLKRSPLFFERTSTLRESRPDAVWLRNTEAESLPRRMAFRGVLESSSGMVETGKYETPVSQARLYGVLISETAIWDSQIPRTM